MSNSRDRGRKGGGGIGGGGGVGGGDPFPDAEMFNAIADYSQLEKVVWCQEEPKNQGAWYNSQHRLRRVIDLVHKAVPIAFAGRQSSASPAAGYMALHIQQQQHLIAEALGLPLPGESS